MMVLLEGCVSLERLRFGLSMFDREGRSGCCFCVDASTDVGAKDVLWRGAGCEPEKCWRGDEEPYLLPFELLYSILVYSSVL